jgi:nucleotide-binding universal stress UspA family protein
MIKIKRILFPTDFSRCAGQTLNHAVFFARKYKAELHLLHVITLFEDQPEVLSREFSNVEKFIEEHKEIAGTKLNDVVELYGSKEIQIIKSMVKGISAAPSVLEYAADNDIDLIVLGTNGRRGLGHILIGSVAEEVVRLAGCPVFTVRETKELKPIKAYKNILVPIDFSDYSKNAISYAKEIAKAYDSQLQLLHIIEETKHPAFSLSGKSSIFDLVPNIEADSRKRIEEMFIEAPGPKAESTIYTKGGHAANDIINFASRNSSDLIVIATHGLTGIEHLLLGSVTEKVVRMAPCPVVTIKSFGKNLIE